MGYLPLPSLEQLRLMIERKEFLEIFTFYECVRDPTALENLCASINFDLTQQYACSICS